MRRGSLRPPPVKEGMSAGSFRMSWGSGHIIMGQLRAIREWLKSLTHPGHGVLHRVTGDNEAVSRIAAPTLEELSGHTILEAERQNKAPRRPTDRQDHRTIPAMSQGWRARRRGPRRRRRPAA